MFASGADKYSEIAIARLTAVGDGVQVRVAATRERSSPARVPGDPPRVLRSNTQWSLLYVREDGEWKLVKEGSAIEGVADALIGAESAAEREAILAADADLVGRELVAALSRRAGQAAQLQAYTLARTGFERMRDVARLVGDLAFEGEALQNLANAYYYLRDFPAALAAYTARLAIERERGDADGISGSLLGIATVRYSQAEYGDALAAYREALAVQEKAGEQGMVAGTLISTGNVLYLQGDYAGAIAEYARSRDIFRKVANAAGEADALEGMGRVLLAQGDYPAALQAFIGVLADARSRNSRDEAATALLSIGDVHFRLGNLESARSAFDEARGHFAASKNPAGEGRAWQAMALNDLAAARFKLSEDEYLRSAATCEQAGDKECGAGATVGLAFAQAAQEKFVEAIATYRAAIDAFTALKRPEPAARARIGLSQALLGSGDLAGAVSVATRARADAEAIANDDVLWRALVAEASAMRKLRARPAALSSAEAAIAAIGRLVETAKVRPSAPVSRDSSTAFGLLALLQAEAGDAAVAFETIEKMRVHDLRLTLAAVERDIARGMSDAEREEERVLAADLVSLHAQITRERGLPKPDAARISALQARIDAASTRWVAQQDRLFSRLPDLRTWRGHLAPATRGDLEPLLDEGSTIVLQLVVCEDVLLAVVARHTGDGVAFNAHFEGASRRQVAERVARLMDPATQISESAWRLDAAALIPGLAAVVGRASRAIVIPHEILWRVPFEAIPTESGYLADATSVVYVPSVSALISARAAAAGDQAISVIPGSLVAAGASTLSHAIVERIEQTAPGWVLRSVANVEVELQAVAAAADPDRTLVLQGESSTETLVRERLRVADIIHLSAPFRVNGGSPLFSPMLFAADRANDGILEPREIMNLDLEARVAVLSDSAALSMRDAADDVTAVLWAWEAAGVSSLVLARWPVAAGSSTALLSAFHAELRAGATPEMALQTARRRLRTNSDTASPGAWAGWLLMAR